ncbi:hypothetical protein BCR42DRAFT_412500 [Absidia repens]|uniref:SMAD/FHA domain-containing protein n=1 Tax=Absidia repens TaxID=90262 RepID=A0A1X2IJT6_9FUNG|nr:hypothetical protein BCR42DRAFT_412500 [Absidia repens]
MGDALCMMMVPPTTNTDEVEQSARVTTSTNERSSFRRSLNLSSGAFGLRRFSRSTSQEPMSDAIDTTTTTNNNVSPRRATIATSVTPRPANTLHVRIVPHIENPSRSLIFDIFDRELQAAVYIKIGRFTDRSPSPTHMSFKSKVVSRAHCEIWMEDGKLFVRDTKSSSGTFLNHLRISPPNQESRPYEVRDGDIVQLGVDYQNGVEEIYRSVKMRFEVNRSRRQRPISFNMAAFQNIRNLTNGGAIPSGSFGESQIQEQTASDSLFGTCHPPLPLDASAVLAQTKEQQQLTTSCAAANETTTDSAYSSSNEVVHGADQVEECCICLYALAPLQALFVSPCAHTYHYKCIRPLLSSYPGFQCPICRTYSDLDANTNLECHEIAEKYNLRRQSTIIDPSSTMTCITHTTSTTNTSQHRNSENDDAPQPQHPSILPPVSSASTSQQPQTDPNGDDDTTPLATLPSLDSRNGNKRRNLPGRSARDRRTVVVTEGDTTSASTSTPVPASASALPPLPTVTNNSTLMDTMDHSLPWQATRPGLPNNHSEQGLTERQNMTTSHDHQPSTPVDDNVIAIPDTRQTFPLSPTSTSTSPTTEHQPRRTNTTSGFVEKLKMVFFEKRKSSSAPVAPRERKRTNRPRPLSYPNFLLRRNYDEEQEDTSDNNNSNSNVYRHDEVLRRSDISSTSSSFSSPTSSTNNVVAPHPQQNTSTAAMGQALSRQSTTHLAEIEEEEETPWHQQQLHHYQAMSVDG